MSPFRRLGAAALAMAMLAGCGVAARATRSIPLAANPATPLAARRDRAALASIA